MAPKLNFNKIWTLMVEGDIAVGAFLLRADQKKTIFKNLLTFVLPSYTILVIIFFISTIYVTSFELIYVILSFSCVTSSSGLEITVYKFQQNKELLKGLFKWCNSLYDIETYFHAFVRDTARAHLEHVEAKTYKILKYLRIILYADAIAVTAGYAIIGCFLPASIYPKYSAPLPFYLPLKHQDTLFSFLLTVFLQTVVSVECATIAFYLFSVFFCIVMHVMGLFNIAIGSIKILKQEILSVKNKKLPIEEWVKILSDMICDANSSLTAFSKLYSVIFFILELAALGALLICGLIVTVINQQYVFAFGFTLVAIFLYAVCYVNENILAKIKEINEALYDIPWYNLEVKQQKMLLILINCNKIQKGFTASGLHTLTMERFGLVLKAAYTNLLVLKDLVQR